MKHKSAVIGFTYLFGLICASFFDYAYCFIFCCICIIAATIISLTKRKNFSVVSFTAGAAMGVYGIYLFTVCQPAYDYAGREMEINGIVKEQSYSSNDMAHYVIETELFGQKMSLLLYGGDKDVKISDKVYFTGKISRLPSSAEFDQEGYYFSKGILLRVNAKSDIVIEKPDFYPPSYYISRFNRHIKSQILKRLPNDYGGLLCAILLGDKGSLSHELKADITHAGASHFMAVSGLHLTVAVHLLMMLLNLTPVGKKRFVRYGILCAAISVLLIFFNLSMSVIRAGIMMLVYYGGMLFWRRGDTLNSLGFALFIILMFSPFACRDIGLLMSVAGTFGIGVVAPIVISKIDGKSQLNYGVSGEPIPAKRSYAYKLLEIFLASSLAYLCTFPLSAVFFEGVSLTAVITSIILQPFFYSAFIAGVIFALSAGYFNLPLLIAGFMAKIMTALIESLAQFKYSYISLDYDFILPWFIASGIFITAIAAIFKSGSKIYKAAAISVCMLIMMITADTYQNTEYAEMKIYSDGASGAVFIRDGKTHIAIVPDTSKNTYSEVNRYIKDNYIDKLTFLCLLDDSNNYSSKFKEIDSILTLMPSDISGLTEYDISGIMLFKKEKNNVLLIYRDNVIGFSKISEAESYADIQIISGYKTNPVEIPGDRVIYLHKRQNAERKSETNAYYDEAKFNFLR